MDRSENMKSVEQRNGHYKFNQEKCPVVDIPVGGLVMHGDVIVERIDKLPDGFKTYKRCENVLAYGEATGHLHMLEGGVAEVRIDPGNTCLLYTSDAADE